MFSSKFKLTVLFYLLINGAAVHATDLRIHGFADLVGSQTSTMNSLNDIGNHEDELVFDPESRLGLNLSADIGEDYVFAGQILARGSDSGAYELTADWIFVTYKPNDRLAVRAGRQINPAFLFSEQIDVGFTYLWVRLPHEIYGYYPIKSFNGVSVMYTMPLGDYRFQTQVFGGAGDVNIEKTGYVVEGRGDRLRGTEFTVSSDNMKFHATYIASSPEATLTKALPLLGPGAPDVVAVVPYDFGTLEVFSAGASLNYGKLLAFVEVSRMLGEKDPISSLTGLYGSLGYEILPKLTPYITYAMTDDIDGALLVDSLNNRKTSQHSSMLGINYKVNPTLVLKAEYMRTEQEFVDTTRNFGANTYTASMDIIF